MSMSVAIERRKEIVRLGSGEARAVEPVLQATKLSMQYGSMTVLAEVAFGGGLGDGNGAV
jgi:hypothetical protein